MESLPLEVLWRTNRGVTNLLPTDQTGNQQHNQDRRLQSSLVLPEQVMGFMTLPSIAMSGHITRTAFTTVFNVADRNLWDEFLVELIQHGEAMWVFKGDVTVKAIGMTFRDLPFNKEIIVKGPPLSSSDGGEKIFEIMDFDMSGSTKDEIHLDLEVRYVNQGNSNIVPLGDMYLDLIYNNVYIGEVFGRDLSVYKGNNTFRLVGLIDPWKTLQSVTLSSREHEKSRITEVMADLVSRALDPSKQTTIMARGRGGSVSLYEAGIRALKLSTPLIGLAGGKGGLEVLQDVAFKGFELLENSEDEDVVGIKSRVVLTIINPLGPDSPFVVQEIRFRGQLHENSASGPSIGVLDAVLLPSGPPSVVHRRISRIKNELAVRPPQHQSEVRQLFKSRGALDYGSVMEMSFEMKGILEINNEFSKFVDRLIKSEKVNLVFSDTKTEIDTKSLLGELPISGFQMDKPVELGGFGGMSNLKLISYRFLGETESGAWKMEAKVSLPNKSPTTIHLGDIILELLYKKVHIGYLAAKDVLITQGKNTLVFEGVMNPHKKDIAVVSDFFSSYISGEEDTNVDVRFLSNDNEGVVKDSYLQQFLLTDSVVMEDSSPEELGGGQGVEEKFPPSTALLSGEPPLLGGKAVVSRVRSSPPTWLAQSLEKLALSFPMPKRERKEEDGVGEKAKGPVSILQKTEMENIYLIPIDSTSFRITGKIYIEASNPLGTEIGITTDSISLDVNIINTENSEADEKDVGSQPEDGRVIGRLTMQPQSPESQYTDGNVLNIQLLLDGRLEIEDQDMLDNFVNFFDHIQKSSSTTTLLLKGKAALRLDTSLGTLNLGKVIIRNQVQVGGFGGQLMKNIVMDNLRFSGRNHMLGPGIAFNADLHLRDVDTKFEVDVGTAIFHMLYQNVHVASIHIYDISLRRGDNHYKLEGVLHPQKEEDILVVSELFSKYMEGNEGVNVDVEGFSTIFTLPDGRPFEPPYLSKSIQKIKGKFELPRIDGIMGKSFSNVNLSNMGLKAIAPTSNSDLETQKEEVLLSAKITADVKSPFGSSSPISIKKTSVHFDLYHDNRPSTPKLVLSRRLTRWFPMRRSLQGFLEKEQPNDPRTRLGHLSSIDIPVRGIGQPIEMELIDSRLTFSDNGEAFGDLVVDLMNSKKVQKLDVVGKLDAIVQTDIGVLSLSHIPIKTDFRVEGVAMFTDDQQGKSSSMNMMKDAMKDLYVQDFPSTSNYDALKMSTHLYLDNPSNFHVYLGPIIMMVLYKGSSVAAMGVPDFALTPGRNKLYAVGAVKPANPELFSAFVSDFIAGRPLELKVEGVEDFTWGEESVPSSQDEFPSKSVAAQLLNLHRNYLGSSWVRRVLREMKVTVNLNDAGEGDKLGSEEAEERKQWTKFISRAALEKVNVDLSRDGNPLVSGDFNAAYKLPKKFDIKHQIIDVSSYLVMHRLPFHSSSSSPSLLATMNLIELTPLSGLNPGSVSFHLSSQELAVPPMADESLSQFFYDVMHTEGSSVIAVKGSGRVRMNTGLGEVNITDIPIQLEQDVRHFGGHNWKDMFKMRDMEIVSGSADGLVMNTVISVDMPSTSKLGVDLGPVLFDMFIPIGRDVNTGEVEPAARQLLVPPSEEFPQGMMQVGLVQVPSFIMEPGESMTTEADAVLLRPVMSIQGSPMKLGPRVLLSRYINGDPNTVVVKGNAQSVHSPFLRKAFEHYTTSFRLDGASQTMLRNVELDVKLVRMFIPQIEAKTTMENPLPVPIEFRYANMTTFNGDKSLGNMAVDYRSKPNIIPANSVHTLPPVKVIPKFDGGGMELFRELLAGSASIHAIGTMEIAIDKYVITLDVDMKDVPLGF